MRMPVPKNSPEGATPIRPTINAFYPITLCVFAALRQVEFGMPAVLLGIGFLWLNVALHELGHAVFACKAGHAVGSVLILPGYGRTNVRSRSPRGRVAMIVAGPLAGATGAAAALLAFRLGAGPLPGHPDAQFFVLLSGAMVADNLLNLVPYGLLDGRRALDAHRQRARADLLTPRRVPAAAAVEPDTVVTGDEGEHFSAEARRELEQLLTDVSREDGVRAEEVAAPVVRAER